MKKGFATAAQFSEWSGGTWEPVVPELLGRPCIDSREVSENDVFFAVNRPEFDAHNFVQKAFESGAGAAVVRRGFHGDGSAARPLLRVDDPNLALSRIAAGYRSGLSAEIVGVTGSMGKTTVKELTADLLSMAGPTARTLGNFNNDFGLPLSLLQAASNVRYGVFEVGMNHPGELAPLCSILKPRFGIMSRIGPVHVGNFNSTAQIAEEKSTLFASLPSDGLAVMSCDDAWFDMVSSRAPCPVVTVSLNKDADFRGVVSADVQELLVVERESGHQEQFHLPMPGRHVAENVLLALAMVRSMGLPWTGTAKTVAAYHTLKGRWQKIRVGEVTVIHDAYNANPASMIAAAEAFAAAPGHAKKWLVLGGMRELGRLETPLHHEVGAKIASGPWAGVLTIGPLGGLIADGLAAGGMEAAKIIRCTGHQEAAKRLRACTAGGDAVLFKASRGEALEKILEYWSAESIR